MATPYQMQQMDKLAALEALTKGIAGQYGGGNDVKSVNPQNEAFAQGARQLGLTDAEIGAQLQGLPWNDQSRYIPAQGLRADELAPAPADAVAGGMPAPAPMPSAPVQAAMPAQAPAPAPAQRQTFLQRLGQGFDQAATAGLIDPSTLTKEQRRILRGQLLMNVGGALSQNRPVGEGFQQQYNMISTRQADQAAKAKAALTAQQEATRRQIYQNADWSTSEGAQKLVNDLSRAGLYDDAMEVTKNIVSKLSDDYTVMSDQIYGTILVDKTGRRPAKQINIPGATPINGIKPYQAATLALKERELGIKEGKAKAGDGKLAWTPVALRDYRNVSGDLAVAERVDKTLSDSLALFDSGLELGPIANAKYQALNYAGTSTEQSLAYAKLIANLSKMRNDSLRLNKGAQTEGDAQRAWDEIAANPNDTEVIKSRLLEIQDLNRMAAEEKQWALSLYEDTYRPLRERPGGLQPGKPTPPAQAKKYKPGETVTINGKKYKVVPGGTDTDPNLQEVK